MQECRDAGLKPLELILGGHRQVCGSDTQENSIDVLRKRIQNGKVSFNEPYQLLTCSLQCHLSKR